MHAHLINGFFSVAEILLTFYTTQTKTIAKSFDFPEGLFRLITDKRKKRFREKNRDSFYWFLIVRLAGLTFDVGSSHNKAHCFINRAAESTKKTFLLRNIVASFFFLL